MNVQQEGLGYCPIHGQSSPILQQVGMKGGVCFACQEDGKKKTGTTVVVTEASPDAKGKVTIRNVNTNESIVSEVPTETKVNVISGEINIRIAVDDLPEFGITKVLLEAAYDAIDEMPPFKTLRETKRAIAIQDAIKQLLEQETPVKPKRKYTKHERILPEVSRADTTEA
jgi:hypothetical protein